MSLLLETIKIENGILRNINYHNTRFNYSRRKLFGITEPVDLSKIIVVPSFANNDIYKCRIIYSTLIHKIEFLAYKPKKIKSLEIVVDNTIEYEYKYLDRSNIESLLSRSKADDIIIVKNGRVTDASFANLAFFDGTNWLTPAYPLLKGTKRQLLLDTGQLIEDEIKPSDLKFFKKLSLINALLDFDNIENQIPIEFIS